MEIYKIKTLWPEDEGFLLERTVGEEFIFIHTLTDMLVIENGKTQKLDAGSCICFAPHSHQCISAPSGGLLHDWMHLSVSFSEIAEKYGFEYGKAYTPTDSGFVTELMREAELEHMNEGSFYRDICEMKISEIIAKLVRSGNTEAVASSVNAAFTEARAKIHMDYRHMWTVEEMANLVHLSPSRFFAVYRSVFGVSPKTDLSNVRLEHARHFLAGGASVKEVSEMTGYTNVYHFIRAFKAHTGVTPGKYNMKSE